MTAMDFRQYDAALGRFVVMDRLTELAPGITPYRFAFNNPNYWSDPSGLFESRNAALAHIAAFGLTGATVDYNGGTGFWTISNGGATFYEKARVMVLAFNTSDGGVDIVIIGGGGGSGTAGSGDLGGSGYSGYDYGNAMSTGIWTVNTSVGFASLGVGYQGQFHKMNEAYHITKSRGTSYFWQNKWKSPVAKQWRVEQISKVQGTRNLATKLTRVGRVLLVGDIALSGDIKPSHVINGLMLWASLSPVGSIVAGVWFVADFGTMGVNYLINGEVKGIGDMIDESDWGKSKTVKMYDGLY